MTHWQLTLGATPENDGTRFRVWAPNAQRLDVVLEPAGQAASHPMSKEADGTFTTFLPRVQAGARYLYRIDGQGPFPDPASRFQPEGVHGPSEVVDPRGFPWNDAAWGGVEACNLVIYELHVGTFTPAGTFAAILERLPYLRDLGITALELMPLADFPGRRNWGYDGVAQFAPARCYGNPDELRRLIDAAHGHGLAVLLDVVYNHLGPDGNYLGVYSPHYFSKEATDWGDGLNFDGPHSDQVRRFFLESALHWIHEYHFDGLRLDATHIIQDEGPYHFLAELNDRVRQSVSGRRVYLIGEDHRNLNTMMMPRAQGGWGLDAVWADDFHHILRRLLTGDCEGHFRDYAGGIDELETTLRQGWLYCGQLLKHRGEPRGSDPLVLAPRQFVHCIQNHDQVGNRAMGDRLYPSVDLAVYRAVTTLLLTSPATPLLFMGEEWAATTPFQFFTDHHEELGRLVTEGRRYEFRNFSAFTDPAQRERIPNPQADATFEGSRLRWDEATREPHASVLRLHRSLLHLRRNEPALQANDRASFRVQATGPASLAMRRDGQDGSSLLILTQILGPGKVTVDEVDDWATVLTTEDAAFTHDPMPLRVKKDTMTIMVEFARPGAVILRKT